MSLTRQSRKVAKEVRIELHSAQMAPEKIDRFKLKSCFHRQKPVLVLII